MSNFTRGARSIFAVLVVSGWGSTVFAAEPAADLCTNYLAGSPAAAVCDKAIADESDAKTKSMLLTRRTFAKDAKPTPDVFRNALIDLGEAIKLDPDNVDALHERAFIFNELGQWRAAEHDLDAQLKLLPNEATAYSERAMSRFNLGELEGAYDDRSMAVKLGPTSSAYLARARSGMWLGKFNEAGSDIAEARRLGAQDNLAAATANVVSAQLTFWRSTSPDGAKACDTSEGHIDAHTSFLIGDCTAAFLAARTNQDKAAALSARSLAWITGANDPLGFMEDSKIAAALDPANPNLRSNLGFAYLRVARPGAAIAQFDAAIALEPDFAKYAGRAQAKLAIGDVNGAEADANASAELQPNRIAFTVLGDAAYARSRTFDKAKDYWLKAYNNGPPDDGLIRRLKAAGVAPPEATPAQTGAAAPASPTGEP